MSATPRTPTNDYAAGREHARTACPHDSPDDRLRRRGFAIVSRPRSGPAVWGRSGHTYTAAEAHELATRELRKLQTKAT